MNQVTNVLILEQNPFRRIAYKCWWVNEKCGERLRQLRGFLPALPHQLNLLDGAKFGLLGQCLWHAEPGFGFDRSYINVNHAWNRGEVSLGLLRLPFGGRRWFSGLVGDIAEDSDFKVGQAS